MLDQMAIWRAWWTGDQQGLTAAYQGPRIRPSTMRGGLVGLVARSFWGRPTSDGETTSKNHVPVAADISTMSSDLLFSEPPKLAVDDDATHEQIERYIEDGLWTAVREGADSASALGGTYLRVVWSKDLSDRPWVSSVDADFAIPEFSWDKLRAVTFWSEVEKSGTQVVRRLERHEPGRILHGVYEGTEDNLGRLASLADYNATAGLAQTLDDGDQVTTGIDQLTAVYVPNMRPNKQWEMPIGRSDYAGIEPNMDQLDEILTSWMRDIRLAAARLIIPETMLLSAGKGQGASFDADRELYAPMMGNPAEMKLELFQPAIRFEEHAASMAAVLEVIIRGAGYSMATFSPGNDDATAAATATEIKQREKKSVTTRGRKIGYWTPELASLLEALLAIDVAQFGAQVTVNKPSVEFPDAVSPDPSEVAATLQVLDAATAVSAKVKVETLHPDWDETQVNEEVTNLTGTDLAKAAEGMNVIATLAANLAKAVTLGGIDEETALAMINLVLEKAVGADGKPIDPTTTDIAGAAEQAIEEARIVAEAGKPPPVAGKAPGAGPPGGRKPPARGKPV
jgi:A118 family predicted phage portal protein